MKKCSKDCVPICDFCRFYNFNGDETGAYTGDGYCVLHEKHCDPEDMCDDFICENYKRRSKTDYLSHFVCPRCGRPGYISVWSDVCTDCANELRKPEKIEKAKEIGLLHPDAPPLQE